MHKTNKQLQSLGKQHYPVKLDYLSSYSNFEGLKTVDVNAEKRNAFIEGLKMGLQLCNKTVYKK